MLLNLAINGIYPKDGKDHFAKKKLDVFTHLIQNNIYL